MSEQIDTGERKLPDDYGTPAYDARWMREKLNLPAESPTRDMQGAMHNVCHEAHGYDAYIKSYKCNDKQGEIARLTVEVANLKELQHRESRDWAEAHDALLTATGTVVDDAGQPTLIELVGRLVGERDALREELSRLKDAVWPGLPKFVSTPEKPQEDFYILVAEGLRAIFESHREPEGEPNEQVQNSNSEPAISDAGKTD